MDLATLCEYDKELLLALSGSGSLFLDNLMLTLTSGLTWLPLYAAMLYIVIRNSETMRLVLLLLGCVALCVALSDGIADFVAKPLTMRPRPCNDPTIKHLVDIACGKRASGFSFFSAHAANTFAIALFFSGVVRSRLLTITMIAWSLLNGYTRLYLGFHYPSDVIVGIGWGAVVALTTLYIYRTAYKRIAPDIRFYSRQYTSSGYDRRDIDVLILVVAATMTYVVGRTIVACQ